MASGGSTSWTAATFPPGSILSDWDIAFYPYLDGFWVKAVIAARVSQCVYLGAWPIPMEIPTRYSTIIEMEMLQVVAGTEHREDASLSPVIP
jgi:hypothetical protein